MKTFLLFFFLLPLHLLAKDSSTCQISSYDKIIKINKVQDLNIIKKSNCSDSTQELFRALIENANGVMFAGFIQSYFQQEYQISLKFTPNKVEVTEIKDLIVQKDKTATAASKILQGYTSPFTSTAFQ